MYTSLHPPSLGRQSRRPPDDVDGFRVQLLVGLRADAYAGRLPARGHQIEPRLGHCALHLGARVVVVQVVRAGPPPEVAAGRAEDLDAHARETAGLEVRGPAAAQAEERTVAVERERLRVDAPKRRERVGV